MASGTSTYWANKQLDLILGATAFTAPGNIFPALFSVAPTAGGGGTEATGSGYARPSITNNTTNFPAASGGVKSNGTTISFAQATGNWSSSANQVAAALFDAVTSGNMLFFGDLTTPKPVLNGDTATFAASSLSITVT